MSNIDNCNIEELAKLTEENREKILIIQNKQNEFTTLMNEILSAVTETKKNISTYSREKDPIPKAKKTIVPLTKENDKFPEIKAMEVNPTSKNAALNFFIQHYLSRKDSYNSLIDVKEYKNFKPIITVEDLYKYLIKNHKDKFIVMIKSHKEEIM